MDTTLTTIGELKKRLASLESLIPGIPVDDNFIQLPGHIDIGKGSPVTWEMTFGNRPTNP